MAYRFKHENALRDFCGQDADPLCACPPGVAAVLGQGPHCFWRCPNINKTPDDQEERRKIRERLETVNAREYLEGAELERPHLEGASDVWKDRPGGVVLCGSARRAYQVITVTCAAPLSRARLRSLSRTSSITQSGVEAPAVTPTASLFLTQSASSSSGPTM